jgi:very-short-patch-repair endonuclease
MEKLGLGVMRITNGDVLENLDGVAEAILREAGGFRPHS